jgi:hypothetical protein
MRNPLTDLSGLARAPTDVVRDLRDIADGVRRIMPALEDVLLILNAGLAPLFADVVRLRETVLPQQERVAHIEHMTEGLSERVINIERAVLQLQARLDAAMRLLPDPNDDRGPLAKAKDAIAGG